MGAFVTLKTKFVTNLKGELSFFKRVKMASTGLLNLIGGMICHKFFEKGLWLEKHDAFWFEKNISCGKGIV